MYILEIILTVTINTIYEIWKKNLNIVEYQKKLQNLFNLNHKSFFNKSF